MNSEELQQELERIIDRTTLAQVCEALARISHAKAEHVRSNWQDNALARCWERAAGRLMTLATVFHGSI